MTYDPLRIQREARREFWINEGPFWIAILVGAVLVATGLYFKFI